MPSGRVNGVYCLVGRGGMVQIVGQVHNPVVAAYEVDVAVVVDRHEPSGLAAPCHHGYARRAQSVGLVECGYAVVCGVVCEEASRGQHEHGVAGLLHVGYVAVGQVVAPCADACGERRCGDCQECCRERDDLVCYGCHWNAVCMKTARLSFYCALAFSFRYSASLATALARWDILFFTSPPISAKVSV